LSNIILSINLVNNILAGRPNAAIALARRGKEQNPPGTV
jgi:hypothetical protein